MLRISKKALELFDLKYIFDEIDNKTQELMSSSKKKADLESDQTFEGKNIFSQNITLPVPLEESHGANKKYVDGLMANHGGNMIAPNQNLLINGSLVVWQRGTSFAAPQNAYTADRMKCTGSGTVSRATANGGMKITGSMNVRYIMEDVDYNQISGKTVTLSYSKSGEITTDTYQSDRYESVSGGRTVVNLNLVDCMLDWIKLELGEIATPFVPRPFVEELALCQRYYQRFSTTAWGFYGIGLMIDANRAQIIMPLSYSMRITPKLIKNGAFAFSRLASQQVTVTDISISNVTQSVVNLIVTASANFGTPGDSITLINYAGGSQYLDLDAEL